MVPTLAYEGIIRMSFLPYVPLRADAEMVLLTEIPGNAGTPRSRSRILHRLMVLTLAAVIGLVLFTIGAMEHPFSGGARIGTGAFDLVLERFETSKLSNL